MSAPSSASARDVYNAACSTVRRQARAYTARMHPSRRQGAYDSYLEGWCNGLDMALARQLAEDQSLALRCVVPTAVTERYEQLGQQRRRTAIALLVPLTLCP